jgi:heme/copper-type cytochrome/quinol oxidase subunit 2
MEEIKQICAIVLVVVTLVVAVAAAYFVIKDNRNSREYNGNPDRYISKKQ